MSTKKWLYAGTAWVCAGICGSSVAALTRFGIQGEVFWVFLAILAFAAWVLFLGLSAKANKADMERKARGVEDEFTARDKQGT